jgi:acetolactate synthase-1/2/3 large subunit
VARRLIGTDAFQETDIIGITQPITKHSFLVGSIEELADCIHEAFAIAHSGRPGPVLVDVPKDVLVGTAPAPTSFHPTTAFRPTLTADLGAAADRAADLIKRAERPLILAGHGIILSGAYAELRAFAERTGIPVVTTLLGISAFPESHPLAAGMPGMHGRAEVNHAITDSDLLIAVGMRFDDRVTGDIPTFAPKARIIHIDIDPSEMGKVIRPTVPIVADARMALEAITARVPHMTHGAWATRVTSRCDERIPGQTMHDAEDLPNPDGAPTPAAVLAAIRYATNGRALMVTDVGQHQMWAARFYGYDRPNTHLTSGGLGTMGFALPAAMGAAMGRPDESVWVVAGDGGIQMNIQELATIMDLGLPIKAVILNNGYLGMVRQWQEFFHQRNYSETRISSPDFVKLAEAYGVYGARVTTLGEVGEAIERAMRTPGPALINVMIEQESNVFPMVAPGKAIADMIMQSPSHGGRHE